MEGRKEHREYAYLNFDEMGEKNATKTNSKVFKNITIPSLEEFKNKTRCLDVFQREIVNIAVKHSKDIVKSQRDGNIAPKPLYLIGHGGAGAGKSTVKDTVSK